MPGNISIFLIICQFCGRNQNTHCTARVSDDGILLVVWWLLRGPIWIVVPTDVTHPRTWLQKERAAVSQVELCGQVGCRQCHRWSQGRHAQWGPHLGTEKGQIFYLCVGEDLQNQEVLTLIPCLQQQGPDCIVWSVQASFRDSRWYKDKRESLQVRVPCFRAAPFFPSPPPCSFPQ